MRRIAAGTAIVAGALCDRPDLFVGWAVRTRRRWGVPIVVDDRGREWPITGDGVALVDPSAVILTCRESQGVRYPAVCVVVPVGVSGPADVPVDAATAGWCGGVGVAASQVAVAVIGGRGGIATAAVTREIDVGKRKGRRPALPDDAPQFHSESLIRHSLEHVDGVD